MEAVVQEKYRRIWNLWLSSWNADWFQTASQVLSGIGPRTVVTGSDVQRHSHFSSSKRAAF
jgi:hypothetical protein